MPRLVAESSASPAPLVFVHGLFGSHIDRGRTRRYLSVATGLGLCNADLRLPMAWDAATGRQLPCPDGTRTGGILTRIGWEPVYSRALAWLSQTLGPGRVHPFAYDWRRDNRESAEQLIEHLEDVVSRSGGRPATVVAHSNGGVVAWLAMQSRPDLFHSALFVGTPFGPGPGFLSDLTHGTTFGVNRKILTAEVLSTHSNYHYFWTRAADRTPGRWPAPGPGECFDSSGGIIDLADAQSWVAHSAGVFGRPKSTRRIDLAEFKPHLERSLDAGAGVRALIAGDKRGVEAPDGPPVAVLMSREHDTAFHATQSDDLDPATGGQRITFSHEPGDGRVLYHLSAPPPTGPRVIGTFLTSNTHSRLVDDVPAMQRALTALYAARGGSAENSVRGDSNVKELESNKQAGDPRFGRIVPPGPAEDNLAAFASTFGRGAVPECLVRSKSWVGWKDEATYLARSVLLPDEGGFCVIS